MKLRQELLLFTLFAFLIASCSMTKKVQESSQTVNCLKLDPFNYNKVMFNPQWISQNGITRIIEREYLDGQNGRIHLVMILDFDSTGFLKTKYNGLSYPKDGSPNEKGITSKVNYKVEKLDSFVFHTQQTIVFHNEKGKMKTPDTLSTFGSLHNISNAKAFVSEEGEILRSYLYDKKGRIIKEYYAPEKELLYSIKYHKDDKIEIVQFSTWKNAAFSSWVVTDKENRIISAYDESNESTHEFKYDSHGQMIEDKHWFKNTKPNYHTYEYIKK